MILHTLNATPSHDAFIDCLRIASAADTIVLLGDGIYGAIAGSAACQALLDSPATVVALKSDAIATGCLTRLGNFGLIDMDGFVALSEDYPRQMAWH